MTCKKTLSINTFIDFRSCRGIILSKDLEEGKTYMGGIVLDVGGGRKRGFEKPKETKWIVLDILKKYSPEILGDAQDLPIKSNSIDCVKCTELLEHVEYAGKVITEIARVLRPNGYLILSVPFNCEIHADPYDFCRFTDYKLRKMLENNFEIVTLKKQGFYFSVIGHMIKKSITNAESRMRRLLYWTLPILDTLVKLDQTNFVKNSKFMSSFTTGFFVVAKKVASDD